MLIERLGSSDKDTRVRAAELLGEIGPSAKAAVPALSRLVQQKGDVGEAAALAIKRITESRSSLSRDRSEGLVECIKWQAMPSDRGEHEDSCAGSGGSGSR